MRTLVMQLFSISRYEVIQLTITKFSHKETIRKILTCFLKDLIPYQKRAKFLCIKTSVSHLCMYLVFLKYCYDPFLWTKLITYLRVQKAVYVRLFHAILWVYMIIFICHHCLYLCYKYDTTFCWFSVLPSFI